MYYLYQTILIYCGNVISAIFFGFLLSIPLKEKGNIRKILSFTMEFSAGFAISIIFLGIIPDVYGSFRTEELILFLILGIFTAMLLQEKLKYKRKAMSQLGRISATTKLTIINFTIANFLRGLSVGTGHGIGAEIGTNLGLSAALYAFPESVSIFLMSKTTEKSSLKSFIGCFLLSVPFISGAFAGAYLGMINELFLTRALIFSCGIAIYSAIGDIGIESKLLYRSRFLPLFQIIGMISGIAAVLYS